MRLITDDERRARLGVRHALAHPVATVEEAARSVVALHGTDPATTVLSAVARSHAGVAELQSALYETRSLVRVLAMRRTVFAVPTDFVTTAWAGAGDVVAREQRRLLAKMLVASGITDDPAPWIARAETIALELFAGRDDVTSAELSAADPMLAQRIQVGPGADAATPTVASRLLTMLSAEGAVVRAEPRGGWTSMQFRWAAADVWCGDLGARPSTEEAATELARRWLRAYGPAHEDDLQWWAGWTKTRTRAALAALDLEEVELEGQGAGPSQGVVLAGDADPVEAPDPWIGLLPALDPSSMGWRHRSFYLGAHRPEVFDDVGNAGPTVWVDGQIVGAWAHLDGGEVAFELYDDVGREATDRIAARAAALAETIGDVRVKARARRWTASEKRLRA